MAEIELEHLTKVFPGGVTAGRISIGGRDVTDLAPRRRDVAMVFQSYALYPHMSVRHNIGYGLKVRRAPKPEIKRRVEEVAQLLGLEDMLDGRILQADAPQTLYQEPVDLFVAAFIGTPAMNLVEARIDDNHAVFGQFRIPLDPRRRPPRGVREVVLGLRPESFEDAAFAPADLPRIEVEITVLEELGSDAHVFFHVDAPRISSEAVEAEGDEATLLVEEKALFNARVDPRTRAEVGSRLELAVDASRFHYFDPKTGKTLLAAKPAREPAERDEVVLTT